MPAMSREASEILFLLGEMRRWVSDGRIGVEVAGPLYTSYATRMRAGGYDVPPLPGAAQPIHSSSYLPRPEASPSAAGPGAWTGTVRVEPAQEFTAGVADPRGDALVGAPAGEPGRPGLSALQVVGAILLVGGVFSIVVLQWETIGAWLLPWLLTGLSLGMTELGRRQEADGENPTSLVLRSIGVLLRPAALQMVLRSSTALAPSMAWTIVGGLVAAWSLVAARRGSRTVEPVGVWLGWTCVAIAAPVAVAGTFQPLFTALLLAGPHLAFALLRARAAGIVETTAWWLGAACAGLALQLARTPYSGPLGWVGEVAVDALLVGAVAATARGMGSVELHGLTAALMPLLALSTGSKALDWEPTTRLISAACLAGGVYVERFAPGNRLGGWGWCGAAATSLFSDIITAEGPTLGGGAVLIGAGLLGVRDWRNGRLDSAGKAALSVLARGLVLRCLNSAMPPATAAILVDSALMVSIYGLWARGSERWSGDANAFLAAAGVLQAIAIGMRTTLQPDPFVISGLLQSSVLALGVAVRGRSAFAAFALATLGFIWVGAATLPTTLPFAWIALALIGIAALLPGNPVWVRMAILQGAAFAAGALSQKQSLRETSYIAVVLVGLMAHLPDARKVDRAVALATGWIPLAIWFLFEFNTPGRFASPGGTFLTLATLAVALAATFRGFSGAWSALAVAIDLAAGMISNNLRPAYLPAWFWWGAGMLLGAGMLPWTASQGQAIEPESGTGERTVVTGFQQALACIAGLALFGSAGVPGFVASIAAGAVVLIAGGRRRSATVLALGVAATLLPPNLAFLDNRLETARWAVLLLATVGVSAMGMVRRWRACLVGGLLSSVVMVHGLLALALGDGAMAATAAVVGLVAVLTGVRIETLRRAGDLPGWLDVRSDWV